jgi:hypothetical protein
MSSAHKEKTMQTIKPSFGLTGLSICTQITNHASAILTYDQSGGHGEVANHALMIPGHLQQYGSPLRSLEFVMMAQGMLFLVTNTFLTGCIFDMSGGNVRGL